MPKPAPTATAAPSSHAAAPAAAASSASAATRRGALAEGVLACKHLVSRFLVGFDDSNHTRQAPSLPNHAAWCLGHLALTMHRVGEMIDGRPIPESDFSAEPVEAAKVTKYSSVPLTKFHTESVAFASAPVDDARLYPDFLRCGEIFNRACDRLAAAVRSADESALDKMAKWGAAEQPLYLLVQRMLWHNGCHTGQILDTRRALGMKGVIR